MKKFNFLALFFCAFFTLSSVVFAQEPSQPNAKAVELMSKGDFRGAVGVVDKDIEENKNLFQAYKLRGALKRMLGDFNGAIDDYGKAIEIKPDNGELFEQRAMARFNIRGDFDLILQDLDAAISYGRKHEKMYSLRGMVKGQRGDIDGAIADYQTAVGLRPESASAHVGLSLLYARKQDDEKAALVLEQFIKYIEESNAKVAKVKGEITAASAVDLPALAAGSIKAGEITVIVKREGIMPSSSVPSQEQIDRITEKMEQSKSTALAYTNLAAIYERQNNYPKALEMVEKGLKIDQNDFYGYEMRGKIKIGLGNYEGAIADINKSISIFPGKTPKYLDRGIAYLMLGNQAEAQKDFDTFLQHFPSGKETLEKRIAQAKEKMQK